MSLTRKMYKITALKRWHGEYAFLSNNYPMAIPYDGDSYPSVTYAFLASKTIKQSERRKILGSKAQDLDNLFYAIEKRPNWNGPTVMKELLEIKFGLVKVTDTPYFYMKLFKKLAQTGNTRLIYGNLLHDNYWGTCSCSEPNCESDKSKNMLGNAIMTVRNRIHDRIKLTNNKCDCHCGNKATRSMLYTKLWMPTLIWTCDDAVCLSKAIEEGIKNSSDKLIVDYDLDVPSNVIYLPPPTKEHPRPIVIHDKGHSSYLPPPPVNTTPVSDPDAEIMEMYGFGYNSMGVWQAGTRQGYSSDSNTTPERKYETINFKGS